MYILIFISLLLASRPLSAWDLADFNPKILFTPRESIPSQEIIKVSAPTSLTITQHNGPLKVSGWDKKMVSIHSIKKGTAQEIENTIITINKDKPTEGIFYIVTPKNPEKRTAQVSVKIKAPKETEVKVISTKGAITTKNLSRAQSLVTDNGTITIRLTDFSVESSVFAHAKQGPIFLEAPRKVQANLSAHTMNGTVTSELFITLQPTTTKLNNDFWKRLKREVYGIMGEGGAPITLETEYGNITLTEKS